MMSEFNPFEVPEDELPQTGPAVTPPPAPQAAPAFVPPQQPEEAFSFAPPAPPQPETTYFAPETAPQKKPRRLKRLLIPVAAVVVVLAVVLCFGGTILAHIAPTWAIGRASVKTTQAVEDRFGASPYMALAQFAGALWDGSLEGDVSYNDGWSDMQIGFNLASDLKNGRMQVGIDALSDGVPVNGQLYLSRDNAALSSTFVNNVWYGATFATFEADLRASALPVMLNLSEQDIQDASKTVADLQRMLSTDSTDFLKPYIKLATDFASELDFKTKSDETTVGGKDVSVTRISAHVSERQIRDLVNDLVDTMLSDENIRDAAVTSLVSDGYYTREEAQAEVDAQFASMRAEAASQMQLYSGDLDLNYYIYQGQLVKVEGVSEPAIEGEKISVVTTMDFGRNPAVDDWTLGILMRSEYDEQISMDMVYSSEQTGANYEDQILITVDDGYNSQSITLENNWDKETGDLVLTGNNGYDSFTLSANLVLDQKSFTLAMDDLGAQTGSDVDCSLRLTAGTENKLSAPEFINLDRWDETMVADVVNQISAAMYGY